MSINLNINGIVYTYPEEGDENWGSDATNWATAITGGVLQKGTGTIGQTQVFTLTGDVDFGATYGLRFSFIRSRDAAAASAGAVRLANAEVINWRNQANTGNLPLVVDSSNKLTFNSIELVDLSSAQSLSNKTLVAPVITGGLTLDDVTLTGNAIIGDASGDTLTVNATSTFNANVSLGGLTIVPLATATLNDNTTGTVFTVPVASATSMFVEYSVIRGTNRQTGLLIVTTNGTTAEVASSSLNFPNGVDAGIKFTADVSGSDLRLRYTTTSTGNNGAMKYSTRRWVA